MPAWGGSDGNEAAVNTFMMISMGLFMLGGAALMAALAYMIWKEFSGGES